MLTIQPFNMGDLHVNVIVAFYHGSKCMLISPENGTTLALNRDIAESIPQRQIPDNLAFLMVQRGFASYAESRCIPDESERIRPDFFLIDLTNVCNLACRYCFRDIETKRRVMRPDMLKEICESLISYWQTHPELNLTIQPWGGEPLLELPLIQQMRHIFDAVSLHPEIVIETNGTLITRDVAESLKQLDVKPGISVDGPADIHNRQRPFANGQPSLSFVEEGIQNLREAGYESLNGIGVITAESALCIAENLQYYAEKLRLRGIKLNVMRQNSRNARYAMPLDGMDDFTDRLLAAMRHLYEKKIVFTERNISQRIANLSFRPRNNICNACGCHGGYRMLSIDCDGFVYPCELSDFPDYRLGTAGQDDFGEMTSGGIQKKQEYFSSLGERQCQTCPWNYYCRGGCRAAIKYQTGTVRGIDRTECAYNRTLYPKLVEILLDDASFAQYLMNGEI